MINVKPKLTRLNHEQIKLWEDFVTYEKQRGARNIENQAYHLTRFFQYINETSLDIFRLRVQAAQEFQTFLVTLENGKGEPHLATFTVNAIISIVSRFYNYLKDCNKVYINPFLRIKRIRTEKKLPRNIPVEKLMNAILEELAGFWKHKDVRQQRIRYKTHVMAELMYSTGMRMGEVLNLKEEDIDFEARIITVNDNKGKKKRPCYLNEYAARILKIYLTDMRGVINKNRNHECIFGIQSNATVSDVFHKHLNEACRKHKVGTFTSHNFRHSLGFHLLKRGCDMRYIQLILGHEDMNTTTIYTKVAKSDLKCELDKYHPRQFKEADHGKC